jgi:HD-like signal output (HDOD) protein
MAQGSIIEFVKERLDQGALELPVFNAVAVKVQQMLAAGDCSAKTIAEAIQRDQALASHVLKVANAPFYAGLNPVKTIRDAIVRLGDKSIANMVMMVTQKQSYFSRNRDLQRLMSPLWSHALGVAVGSRWLALHLGLERLAEEAFMAGLLHDIGKLLLLRIVEDLQHDESIEVNVSGSVVQDILEAMHTAQGEILMRHLNMPESYCQVVARHHDPTLSEKSLLVNLIRLVNLTCHKLGIGLKSDPGLMLSTTPEAINVMAADLILAELQVKLEEYKDSVDSFLSGH